MSYYPYCPNPDPRTMRCFKCGRLCEPRANGWQHERPRCGAWMPKARTVCVRTVGHAPGAHRSQWAVDYQNGKAA